MMDMSVFVCMHSGDFFRKVPDLGKLHNACVKASVLSSCSAKLFVLCVIASVFFGDARTSTSNVLSLVGACVEKTNMVIATWDAHSCPTMERNIRNETILT